MKKKYGFTLVEMFAVIIILGILAGVGIWRLSTRNADRYKAEMCVNQIYSKLSNFIHQAMTSKIPEGRENIPNTYILKTYNGIYIQYGDYNSPNVINTYDDNREEQPSNCIGQKFIIMDGKSQNFEIFMNPGFKTNGNSTGIRPQPNSTSERITSADIHLNYCDKGLFLGGQGEKACEDFAKITLDTRSGILRKSFCQLYNTDDPSTQEDESKTCKQRSL